MGPLEGLKIIELWCIGPGPFAGMLLSDMGAEIIRVDRPVDPDYGYPDPKYRTLWRNRKAVAIDLETPEGINTFKRLISQADGFIEGNRPGVCEKMGIGPDDLLAINPRLVYGRMTGFGQTGPLADQAGFDLSFISLTGVAHAVGTEEEPVPPLILGGDFGGGGTYLALGMLAGILSAKKTGVGQVVDAAMVDGSASLMSYMYGGLQSGVWKDKRAANNVDGGHWLYRMYRCADDKFISVACLSPKLYKNLESGFLLDPKIFSFKAGRDNWKTLANKLQDIILRRSRDEWVEHFEDLDACVQPVLSMEEAPNNEHLKARKTFVTHGDVIQPAPAPRFSESHSEIINQPPENGQDTAEVLRDWGFDENEISRLHSQKIIGNQ